MDLLFVVQRYGREVAGGAELHCRRFATRLAGRGHGVDVLTTCAVSYVDWANRYPPGLSELDGVRVHRLPTARPRRPLVFNPLNRRVVWAGRPVALHLQREWMRAQGPDVPELGGWLWDHAADYDVVVFFSYLYMTTWAGLGPAAGRRPTVLHPTAHDEPPLYLGIFDTTFRLPAAFAFSTEEEAALVRRRFRVTKPSAVVGIGVDLDHDDHAAGAGTPPAQEWGGVGRGPYLAFVGRVEPAKGSDELFDFFVAYKARNPGPLKLVVVGEPVQALPDHPDVVATGFVDDRTRRQVVDGALALVQPSYFESFSMVLSEAWAQGRPALVQGHCDVLVGQAERSGGAIPYRGFAEFEAAVDAVVSDPALATELGRAGRGYVEANYSWDVVLDRYERLLARVA